MTPAWLIALRAGAQELELSLTAEQEDQLGRYLDLLLTRNRVVNLTAITDPVEVAVKHFVDALTIELVWVPRAGDRVIDLGTGAGLPGVPLAIRHLQVEIILNDSVRKKVDFLREVAEVVPLPNVKPVWARAEELGRNSSYRGRFQTAFARALAHLAVISEYALPLLKEGGLLICQKGPAGLSEIAECRRALAALGGSVKDVRQLSLRGAGERVLIVIVKTRPTPPAYPRQAGMAKKHPLYLDSEKAKDLE